jgi:N-acetylmuramoyl-L-alanine amidase
MAGFLLKRSNSGHAIRRCASFILCATLAGVVSFGATPKTEGKVTSVRFWSLGETTRVAIEVSSEFKYKFERLTNPDRLFFDIQGAKPEIADKRMHVIAVGDALLKQIRIAETQPGVTRVVLDLAQSAEFTASQLSGPDRLMIEVHLKDRTAPPATISTSGVKSLIDSPVRAIEADLVASGASTQYAAPTPYIAPPAPPPAAVILKPESTPKTFEPPPLRPDPPKPEAKAELIPLPSFATISRTPRNPLPPPSVKPDATLVSEARAISARPANVPRPKDPAPDLSVLAPDTSKEPLPAQAGAGGSRSLTRVLGLKLGRVVIDPGHGGHDVGTHGPSGLTEKEVVLDVSTRLGALLEDRLATEVVYTRSNDTYIPLEERTRIANDHKADLFLSIHANSSPYRTAAGVETYYLNFTTSKAALDLAARENASSERSVFDLKDILQKIALKDKIDESREFAASLQNALYGVSSKGNAGAKNRGTKKAPFVVLIGASMPSVLAEIGFLTNSADEASLRKPEQRQKIAEALYKGIAGYAETLSHFQVAKRE